MKHASLKRMSIVIAVCALVGALAGIAGSAAAPSNSSKATQAEKAKAKAQKKAAKKALKGGGLRPGFGHGGPGGGPVHSEAVVPNEAGTGFDTITTDSGKLTSVDGSTLKITEGTDKKKYKDVTIDVGSSPTVVRNREKATLSDLKEGDHVHVIQAPKGNFVMAEDDAFIAKEQKDHEKFGGRHGFRGGPGRGPGFGPPPPGAPADPPPPGQDPGGNENGSDSGSSSSGSNS